MGWPNGGGRGRIFERAGSPAANGLSTLQPDRRAAHAAAFGLMLRQPGKSAVQTLSAGQREAIARAFGVVGITGLAAPEVLVGLAGLAGAFYFSAVLLFRVWIYVAGMRPVQHVATLPLYWPLQSVAMVRALYGLAKCPHFWAKTPHKIAG